jgi:hypothetical protein
MRQPAMRQLLISKQRRAGKSPLSLAEDEQGTGTGPDCSIRLNLASRSQIAPVDRNVGSTPKRYPMAASWRIFRFAPASMHH